MNVGPGRPVTIIFESVEGFGPPDLDVDEIELVNGGVMHVDADGNVRWHPGHVIRMVVTR